MRQECLYDVKWIIEFFVAMINCEDLFSGQRGMKENDGLAVKSISLAQWRDTTWPVIIVFEWAYRYGIEINYINNS